MLQMHHALHVSLGAVLVARGDTCLQRVPAYTISLHAAATLLEDQSE